MNDYSHLIGPEPTPVETPKFPTPWTDDGQHVIDSHGVVVTSVNTPLSGSYLDTNTIAVFIAQAVNEKIARDAQERELAETGWIVEVGRGIQGKVNKIVARLELQAFIDAVREARERDLALKGHRDDVEYWISSVHGGAFYRLTPEDRDSGVEDPVDTYYADTKQTYWADLPESFVREEKTPCSVLDVPEEFRL